MPSPTHAPVRFSAPDFEKIERDMDRYRSAGLAPRTVSSYESDMRTFRTWCAAANHNALPATPHTVHCYICDLIGRGRKITTAERHAAAVSWMHRRAGYANPCDGELRTILAGARRTLCQPRSQKEPLHLGELRRVVETIGTGTAIGARNCAVLVFGLATSLRRANLAALTLDDLTFTPDGVLVRVIREKQDRIGRQRTVTVPVGESGICPVRILSYWLCFRGEKPGPLFQGVMRGHVTGRGIAGNRIGQIVQECVASIGLDRRRYAAHSLRAGFVTEALAQGVNEAQICRQTGHASVDTLRIYFRPRDLFVGNAAAQLGF